MESKEPKQEGNLSNNTFDLMQQLLERKSEFMENKK